MVLATLPDTTLAPAYAAAAEELRGRMRGQVLTPGAPGYDVLRRVWNGMIDKRPAIIARCSGTADVVAAVNVAREHNLELAVRGGGHNVAGTAVNDGGLVIDLSAMRGISVDVAHHRVRVQAGANWGDVDHETQVHALATPGGQVSTTGVAGFTLGGGMGFLRRKWGLACDNLLAVEIVTADGQVRVASPAEHPHLFWALRGGGGNFGVVTAFEFQLYWLGPQVYLAAPIYPLFPLEESRALLRAWRDWMAAAPDEVTGDALFWGMPPLPFLPQEMHGMPVIMLPAFYAGPAEEGERLLQPLRELATPLVDLSHAAPYTGIQSEFDPFFPNGLHYYWKSLFLNDMPDDVLDAVLAVAADRPSPQVLLALRSLGGAMSRVPEDATAYGNRAARFNLSIDATWHDPAQSERHIAWTRRNWAALREQTAGGVYLNFAGLGEENDLLAHAAYGANYARLREIKRRYDPTNLFRGNVNIAP
jgi:FAD/FMN-containing dehydrogenase